MLHLTTEFDLAYEQRPTGVPAPAPVRPGSRPFRDPGPRPRPRQIRGHFRGSAGISPATLPGMNATRPGPGPGKRT